MYRREGGKTPKPKVKAKPKVKKPHVLPKTFKTEAATPTRHVIAKKHRVQREEYEATGQTKRGTPDPKPGSGGAQRVAARKDAKSRVPNVTGTGGYQRTVTRMKAHPEAAVRLLTQQNDKAKTVVRLRSIQDDAKAPEPTRLAATRKRQKIEGIDAGYRDSLKQTKQADARYRRDLKKLQDEEREYQKSKRSVGARIQQSASLVPEPIADIAATTGGTAQKILAETTHPLHAISGAAKNAAGRGIKGLTPAQIVKGAKKGLKEKTTYSDVLKEAGVENKAVRFSVGLVGDVVLDPVTYLTLGTAVPARQAAAQAAKAVEKRALAKGLTPEQAKRMAARKAKQVIEKAAKEGTDNKGLTIGFGKHRTSGKTTAALSRKLGVSETTTRVKEGRKILTGEEKTRLKGTNPVVEDIISPVNPNYRKAGVPEEAHVRVRAAEAEKRAAIANQERRLAKIAKAFKKKHSAEDYRVIIDAIESGTVGALRKTHPDLHDAAVTLRSEFRHMDRLDRQAGIRAGTRKNYVAHVKAGEKDGVEFSSRPARGGDSAKKRTIDQRIADLRDEHPDLFTEDVPTILAKRGPDTYRGIADVKLMRELSATGRKYDGAVDEGEAIYHIPRKKGSGHVPVKLTDEEATKVLQTPEQRIALKQQARAKSREARRLRRALQPKPASPNKVLKRTEARHAKTSRVREREAGKLEVLRRELADVEAREISSDLSKQARDVLRRNRANEVRRLRGQIKAQEKRLALVKTNREFTEDQVREAQRVASPYYNAVTGKMQNRKRGAKVQPVQAADAKIRYKAAKRPPPRTTDEIEQLRREAADLRRRARAPESGQTVVLNEKLADDTLKNAQRPVVEGHHLRYRHFHGKVKTALTMYMPSYHARNAQGDISNASYNLNVGELASSLNTSRKALKARRGKLRPTKSKFPLTFKGGLREAEASLTPGAAQKFVSGKTVKIGNEQVPVETILREAEQHGAIGTGFSRELRAMAGEAEMGKTSKIRDIGQGREDWVRLASYIGARRQGLSAREAAARVRETHFDYSDLTRFERGARDFLPFYTFAARNTPLQAKTLARRPGKIARYQKLIEEGSKAAGIPPEDLEDYMKEYERIGLGIPLFGLARNVVMPQGLMVLPGNPAMDLNRLTLNPQEQVRQIMSMVTVLKAGVELGAGQKGFSFFFRDNIDRGEKVPAPDWMGSMPIPAGVKKELGLEHVYDARYGKKIWKWKAKWDYLLKQLPETSFLFGVTTSAKNRRGQDRTMKLVSLTGMRPQPIDKVSVDLDKAYNRAESIDNALKPLYRAQVNRENIDNDKVPAQARHLIPKFERLSKKKRDVQEVIWHLSTIKYKRGDAIHVPKAGAPPKPKSRLEELEEAIGGTSNERMKELEEALGGPSADRMKELEEALGG